MRYLLLVLFPLFAFAGEPRAIEPGTYSYKDFSLLQKRRYETVNELTEAGKYRLRKLLAEGYICRKLQLTLCYTFEEHAGKEGEVRSDVNRRLRNVAIKVEPRLAQLSLPAQPDTEEWQIAQPIEFMGQRYESYTYMISAGQHRIFLGEGQPGAKTLLVAEDGSLKFPMDIVEEESRQVYRVYFTMSDFLRM